TDDLWPRDPRLAKQAEREIDCVPMIGASGTPLDQMGAMLHPDAALRISDTLDRPLRELLFLWFRPRSGESRRRAVGHREHRKFQGGRSRVDAQDGDLVAV